MTPCAITHAASHLRPALCFLLQVLRLQRPALRHLLSAFCFLLSASNSPLPALCTRLPALHSCIELSAPCFLLPTSCLLRSLPLLSTLCALCSQPSAFCFLLLAHSASTLYSLLSTHCFCALSSLPSALCPQLSAFRSLPFNIGTLRKMVFREVVSMGSEPQLFHASKKRVRSATSRRTPTLSVCYQLAFFTPGIRPFEAISRNWIRLMPN